VIPAWQSSGCSLRRLLFADAPSFGGFGNEGLALFLIGEQAETPGLSSGGVMPKLEWPELERALASLVADVAKESDIALERFLEWCTEYQCEIKAVVLEGGAPAH
jgi:hypothetical protein